MAKDPVRFLAFMAGCFVLAAVSLAARAVVIASTGSRAAGLVVVLGLYAAGTFGMIRRWFLCDYDHSLPDGSLDE